MLFGPAPTATWPLATGIETVNEYPVSVLGASRNAPAPLVGAWKVMTPPSTGSRGSLAVTVTASGLGNAAPMAADCGVLPAAGGNVKAWPSKGPMPAAPRG